MVPNNRCRHMITTRRRRTVEGDKGNGKGSPYGSFSGFCGRGSFGVGALRSLESVRRPSARMSRQWNTLVHRLEKRKPLGRDGTRRGEILMDAPGQRTRHAESTGMRLDGVASPCSVAKPPLTLEDGVSQGAQGQSLVANGH